MADPPPFISELLNGLEEPALLLDGDRPIAANAAARRLFGRSLDSSDIRLAIRHPTVLQLILSRGGGSVEASGIGGAERSWQVTAAPIRRGMQLIRFADRSALRAAEKARVDFVANASHELRTPLATILGYAETLAEEGELDEQLRQRFGENIHREARRMLRIVEDLMSLSRIEADRFAVPRDKVDIAEVVQIAADHGRALADPRGCTIETQVEEGLAPVAGDFGQLVQLLDNLVSNALRYGCSRPDSIVTVSAIREGNRALLSVKDQGEGIAAVHIPRLTQRFYRVDDARSRDSGGTGLGLAIVKHIVERHRGELQILSRPGKGTEVQVRLPLA